MESKEFDQKYRKRFDKMATTTIADAMDKVGIRGAVIGIRPMYDCPNIVGRAITIKITAVGMVKSKYHLGVRAIDAADRGDIIIIDNRGDLNNNCWGEVLSMGAKMKGVSGVVVDGAARDIDACKEFGFPVYARGAVPITARGRIMEESFNEVVRIGDVQVRPGDIILADINGVVIIPVEKLDEVLGVAQEIFQKEEAMVEELKKGVPILEVDQKYAYESMLKK
ncbi:MAG: dimethylmenaquinone methyltransferase [Deltaproteobacteria bacterium RBG_13_53_10]|nr:MAG: dimethylmenaquinone methyltransferase [Deltaproteobacteria bacterium RBG_13_53_10]